MGHDNNEIGHISPISTYVKIAMALFALTFLTVGFHAIHQYLGPFAALIAFSIAAVKAFLVMGWFMHLKYETPLNKAVFASGFAFLVLLFVICIIDIYSRIKVDSVL